MRDLGRGLLRRVIGSVLSLCLVAGPVFSSVPIAYAQDAASEQASEPTVVKEDLSRRTENSKHFLLSDGTYRAEIYETPIHFKDESGQWQDIETDLVPSTDLDEWKTDNAPVTARFRGQGPGKRPARIERDGWSVELDMLGVAEDAKLIIGNKARYLGVAHDADLEYQALGNGLKETIVLSSADAPNAYTFFMALENLSVCQTPLGDWVLVDGQGKTVLRVGSLLVFDSSKDKGDNSAVCEDASMSVSAAPGGAYVTYSVPETWLESPDRVFPVMIDPTLTANQDTFIGSGYPTTANGSSTELRCGYYDATTGYNRSLVKFDLSSISKYATVTSATYKAWQFWQYYNDGTSTDTYLGRMDKTWDEASTWNSVSASVNNWSGFMTPIGTQSTTARWQEVDWTLTSTVQGWVHGTYTNYGLVHYQSEYGNQNGTHWRKFYSSEYGTTQYRPQLVVNYYTPYASMAAGATLYKQGDTASAEMKINTSHVDDVKEMRTLVNYVSGSSETYRGYLGWFKTSAGVPGGWSSHRTLADGSVLAHYDGATYGSDHIEPDWAACTYQDVTGTYGYKRVTFRFKLNDTGVLFGEQQDNDFDTYFQMGTGEWVSGWVNQNTNVDVAVYSDATESTSISPAQVRLGTDTVTEVLTVNTSYPADIRDVRVLPNYANGTGAGRYRGYFGWFRDSVPSGWSSAACSTGGLWGWNPSATWGGDKITFDAAACTVSSTSSSKTFTFKWLPSGSTESTAYGDIQNNTGDYLVYMGAYGNNVWNTGWNSTTSQFDVLPKPVDDGSAQTEASDWFSEIDRNTDGIPDNANDTNGQGRGDVTLSWSASPLADGYRIYLFDGGEYREVGETVGNSATSWSSAGVGIFPTDTEIAGKTAGAWTGDPFYRGASPSAASLLQGATVHGPSNGTGLVVTDGSYLYIREYDGDKGPTSWTKIGTGLAGTVKDQVYGTVGPDLSCQPARSAFYFDGVIYSGYAGSPQTIYGYAKSTPAGDGTYSKLHLPAAMLDKTSGSPLTSSSSDVLLASDGERIFSVADLHDSGHTAFKIRVFERDQTSSDHMISVPSHDVSGVFADGENLYLLDGGEHGNGAVTRISTQTWTVTGRWSLPVDTTHEVGGAYDPANNVFWIGATDSSGVRSYAGPGLDLRDSANALYTATDGTSYDARSDYAWRVVPYSEQGAPSVTDNNLVNTALADRTVGVNDEPRHTVYDLGAMAGQSAAVELDEGDLSLSMVDLSIDTYGPGAALVRTYDSEKTTGTFAPGWRFGYEQTLDVSGSLATYTDSAGEEHRFVLESGAWHAPLGFRGTLAPDGTDYKITLKDRSVLRFEGGVLVSETDRNGNETTYDRSQAGHVIITAENGHEIDVETSSGAPVRATYTAPGASATREVVYSRPDATTADVTYYPGEAEGYTLRYTYGPDSRISAVTVLDDDGTNEYFAGVQAQWDFAYTAGDLASVGFPEHAEGADSTLSLAYSTAAPSGETTVTVSRTGVSVGTNQNATVNEWRVTNPTGTLARSLDPTTAASASVGWSYTYTPDGEPFEELSPTGKKLSRTYDNRGNVIYDFDELGHRNAYHYDENDQIKRSTDPLGCTTYSTYDAHGNLTVEERQLNATDRSRTQYTYSSEGLVTQEKRRISSTEWATTRYSDFATNGEPETTYQDGVKLSSADTTHTITTTTDHDVWGNAVASTDGIGVTTSQQDFGDLGLLAYASEDASSVVSHTRYDLLGNQTESWRTAPGTSIKADWRQSEVDPFGRTRIDYTYLHDGATRSTQTTVTHTFDALARETVTDDAMVGGLPSETRYDARGNAVIQWSEGLTSHMIATATTAGNASESTYDAYGQLTSSLAPGTTAPTTYVYNADGTTARVDNPDGTWATYVYDDAGNQVSQRTQDGTSATCYDVGGRTVSSTSLDGVKTSYALDLLSRQTAVLGASNVASSTATYNALGQTLSSTDADHIQTLSTFDEMGHQITSSVAGKTTRTAYDGDGHMLSTTDPDGAVVTYRYDEFGRTAEEIHTTSAGEVRHTVATADSLGRTLSTSDAHTGIEREYVYPTTPDQGTTVVVSYAGITTTTTVDAGGLECTRTVGLPDGLSMVRAVAGRDTSQRETGWTVGGAAFTRAFRSEDGKLASTGPADSQMSFSYDSATGRKTGDSGTPAFGASLNATYSYTDTGRLASDTTSGAATCEFDAAGNITTETVDGTAHVYDYDSGNRLENISVGGSVVTTFTFDATHGWRTAEGPLSNPTEKVFGYTGTGRLKSYDTSIGVSATYEYDANGQRIGSRVVEPTAQGSTTIETRYIYDGLSLLSLTSTRTAEGTSAVDAWTISYLYDGQGAPYGGSYQSKDDTAVPFIIVTTDRGDVVELRDADGEPFAAYRYDAWGVQRAAECTSTGTGSIDSTTAATIQRLQPLRYAGYCFDGHSGLYYLSARSYDPVTRQFLSKDPAKADGEESAYQYCGGGPAERVDPSGLRLEVPVTWLGRQVSNTKQGMSNWCWAAASMAVIKFRIPASNVTQPGILYWVYGDTRLNAAGYPGTMELVLEHWGLRNATLYNCSLTKQRVKSELVAGRPIIARIGWTTGGGHAVVIERISSDLKNLEFMDPWFPAHKQKPFSDFVSNSSFSWSHSITS